MHTATTVLHIVVGLLLLAEGLNKLERTDVWRRGMAPRERCAEWLRALGWGCLTLGGAGVLVATWMPAAYADAAYLCVAAGCALLTVRARVREGLQVQPAAWPPLDEFDRTVVMRAGSAEAECAAALRASMAINGDKMRGERQR